MNDRIKLAEARGWKHYPPSEGGIQDKKLWHWELGRGTRNKQIAWYPHELPDPFTDANDDYAVLEWIRNDFCVVNKGEWLEGMSEKWKLFKDNLPPHQLYQIGNYAKAALKVIDND